MLRDLVVGSDPGLVRLRMAVRTTVTLALTLALLLAVTSIIGAPFTTALIGVVVAMLISMSVNDDDVRARLVTTALVPVAAGVAVTLGALLQGNLIAEDLVFLAVMVVAVLLRAFGPRGTALGLTGFMTYFFSLFLKATLAQLPLLLGAVVVGAAVTFLVRTFLLPDRPARILRLTLEAVAIRSRGLVDGVLRSVAGRGGRGAAGRLRRRTRGLEKTLGAVEDRLDDVDGVADALPGAAPDDVRVALFDLRLAAEGLVEAAASVTDDGAALSAPARDALTDDLRALRSMMRPRGRPDPVSVAPEAGETGGSDPRVGAVRRASEDLDAAFRRLRAVLAGDSGVSSPTPSTAAEPAPEDDEQQDDEQQEDAPPQSLRDRLRPLLAQAVQVVAAGVVAIVGGELLSTQRWYWAVITAFVVFTGTKSRGDVLTKGWQRVLGTAAGVPLGIAVATLVDGNVMLSVVLIFVCLFLGFYLVQVATGWLLLWITVVLALLYGLMGSFSPSVLGLRLAETAIGAAAGVLAAAVILPTRTRTTVRDAMRSYLESLAGLVRAAAGAASGAAADRPLLDLARDLSERLEAVHTAAAPAADGLGGVGGRADARRFLRALAQTDRDARILARTAPAASPMLQDDADGLRAAADRTARSVDLLRAALDGDRDSRIASGSPLLDDLEERLPEHRHRAAHEVVQALRRLDLTVESLGHDLGLEEERAEEPVGEPLGR